MTVQHDNDGPACNNCPAYDDSACNDDGPWYQTGRLQEWQYNGDQNSNTNGFKKIRVMQGVVIHMLNEINILWKSYK